MSSSVPDAFDAVDDALEVRLSEVVASLSHALDLTEGMPAGHATRSCVIGMRVAEALGLPDADRSALFYALLLKDLGCSSNAAKMAQLFDGDERVAKANHKRTLWTAPLPALSYVWRHAAPGRSWWRRARHVAGMLTSRAQASRDLIAVRCERGAAIAAQLGFPSATSEAIAALDEHWDGRGHPLGLAGDAIPLLGRILQLAQTTDVYAAAHGPAAAVRVARQRSGRWFDPALSAAFVQVQGQPGFWASLADDAIDTTLASLEPRDLVRSADAAMLDRLAAAFADVIDAKSPWTFRHSTEVTRYADAIASELGLAPRRRAWLRRAALLHDIGKLGVASSILDKPGRLTDEEFAAVQQHPAYTEAILGRVAPFRGIAAVAGMHHERLDGRGYHAGRSAAELPLEARILAVADQFEALSSARPYRDQLDRERVLAILRGQVGSGLDARVVAALERVLAAGAATPEPHLAAARD